MSGGGLLVWWRRVVAVARWRRCDADFDEELAAHLEMAVEENVRRGMSPEEARRQARLAFGGVEAARELHRETRGLPTLESVAQDVRYAVRTLRRSPGFALLAVTILALGIGANTAIFSLTSAILLRPLPFPDPDRLVLLWDDLSARGAPARVEPTPADYAAWKEQSRSFEDMAVMVGGTWNLTGDGEPEKLSGVRTTANLFRLLGMRPLLGRTLEPYDDEPAANAVVVVSDRLWRSRFGADPGVVGRSILLDERPRLAVGVVPSSFPFPERDATLWVAGKFTAEELAERSAYMMNVVARLRPDVDLAAAQAEMTTIAERLARERPETNTDVTVLVTRAHEHFTRGIRPALFLLLAAVGLVLLITCANVANLLLAHGAGRQRELALRRAIGAGGSRLFRQLLTESAVLAAAGVTVGVALSTLSFDYLAHLVPGAIPAGVVPRIDGRVLIFTGAVVTVMVLAFGTGPALAAARLGSSAALRSRAGGGRGGRRGRRMRELLVVAEITLTLVLLVGAGLLLRSYANVLSVEPGFDPTNLLIAETALSPARYASAESRASFYGRVLEQVKALPGVEGAGYVQYPPILFKGGRTYVSIEGQPAPRPEDFTRHIVSDRTVSAEYLATLGVPLRHGRHFDQRDGPQAPPVVIVNQRLAELHWPDRDPVGRRLKIGQPDGDSPWFTVVGVVGTMRQMGLDAPPEPEMYFPLMQRTVAHSFHWPRHLVVRTEGDPLAVAAAVREAVWDVDADQPVSNLRSMTQVFEGELQNRNTQMTLIGAFAALALLMASLGLYGVLSYAVAERRQEIGVRMALGAQRVQVIGGIVRDALVLSASGLVLGVAAASAVTRWLSSNLFGVGAGDPTTFAAASLLVLVVSVSASFVPARRAAGVDPLAALRLE